MQVQDTAASNKKSWGKSERLSDSSDSKNENSYESRNKAKPIVSKITSSLFINGNSRKSNSD